MPQAQRLDRRDLLLGLLSYAASAADVIAFLKLDHVFTSAMTGNTALLGMALGQNQVSAAWLSFLALTGYIAGVAAGALVRRHNAQHALRDLLSLESVVLLAITAYWWMAGFPSGGPALWLSVLAAALAMGLQSVAARKINVDGVPTVVFTSTLTSVVISLTQRVAKACPGSLFNARRQALAFSLYAAGAMTTAALLRWREPVALALPLFAVVAARVALPAATRHMSVS